MTAELVISPELSLPIDAVTQTFGILAKKGAGKSNAAVVMAEEMWKAGVPWVAIDPKGDWYGLRSSADGQRPGLPLVVFGGRHGDIPLEPTAGAMVADLILANRLTCILDVSEFSKADVVRFLIAFGDRLYRQAEDDPLHLFLEEAHEYLPQRVMRDEARLVGVWQKIVKQGRFKGIGCTLVTQRSASLNKDVLTQVDTLIVLRTTSPQDRAAVKAWVDVHASTAEMMHDLPSLADGEAWVWSPEFLHQLVKIRFRRRETFDSGATPKVGQTRRPPATLADVDLAAIKEAMAETIERAKADDPKELRKRIAVLETQLKATVPVVEVREIEKIVEVERLIEVVPELVRAAVVKLVEAIGQTVTLPPAAPPPVESVAKLTSPSNWKVPLGRHVLPAASTDTSTDTTLGKTERNVLTVLVLHGALTHNQIALLAGYSAKASTIGVALGKLRKLGYVDTNGQPVRPTQAGVDYLGDDIEPLPQGRDLLEYWRNRFGMTERRVLDVLVAAWPNESSQAEIAEATGYSPGASTIGVALGKLRKVGVVTKWRLSDEFGQAIS